MFFTNWVQVFMVLNRTKLSGYNILRYPGYCNSSYLRIRKVGNNNGQYICLNQKHTHDNDQSSFLILIYHTLQDT